MKTFKDEITLIRNNRGCYILDTVKGCSYIKNNPNGCYNDCYAKNITSRYGFDFSKAIDRKFYYDTNQLYLFDFYDNKHEDDIIKQIKNIKMPFVRIGEMGDPSENWEHTINICKIISVAKKPIVIITKHWKNISDNLLKKIKDLNICINTSISALDNDYEIEYRLRQYKKLKNYCNSVLRIVSCNFNKQNYEGCIKREIQEKLFKNEKTIDTIFRPSKNNPFVVNKIINIEKVKFLKSNVLASVYNKKSYLGNCENCPDMCGINL
jgi:hypothetical protein